MQGYPPNLNTGGTSTGQLPQQNAGSTAQLTPEYLQAMQAWQDQQKKMQMAQALMGNQADPKTANAGIANAGNDLLGASIQNRIQQQNSPEAQIIQQRYGMTPAQSVGIMNPSLFGRASGLFNMGGGGS